MTTARVTAVRTEEHGLVTVAFTPTGWELHPTPEAVLRLRRRFWWWCSGMVLAITWMAIAPPLLRAPGTDGGNYFMPGLLLLFVLLCYAAIAAITLFSVFGLRRLGFGSPRKLDSSPLLVVPADAVAEARVSRSRRRAVITVRMLDGTEFHYSRRGRTLENGFANLLGSRLM